ncbi:hypothetical protein B0H14DRAFT_3439228 [Mycena olivaceomarginata]|nr:hypothetical protein B0H14DRAFT_3439228 [Mycena olivaceomarginata]
MVPFDQPEAALDMFSRWISNTPLSLQFSLDEDDIPQVALKPATRERPKSMPPVSSAPQAEQARVDGEAARPRARNVWRPQRMKHARTDAVWLHEQEHRGEKRRKHKVEVYIMRPVVQIIQPQIAVATVAKLFSFLSAALASTGFFCYFGVASNSVVLILPGFIVLWIPRDHVTQYHLGVTAHVLRGRTIIGSTHYACSVSHDANGPWWPRTKSLYWAFLTVPIYSLFLSMRNQVPGWNKEMILKKVTAEFCVGSTLKHPNIIATPEHKPKRGATMPAGSVLDPPRAVRARAASTSSPHLDDPASTCNSSETTSILSYTDCDSGSTSITDPPSRITTHSGGSAGALADELGSPRCLQIQNAQPVFKNTVTLPVMGLLTTDSPTEAEMDRSSTELLPLSPREPYTDLTFPSTPSSHTDDLPTLRVGTMPLAVPMSPPRTRVATFNAFHTVHVKQAAD